MHAVNLIPTDERRNAGGAAGRSNGAAYLVLAVLAAAVLVVGLHALLGSRAADATADAAALNAQAGSLEARSAALAAAKPTASYATLRAKRVEAVTSLVRSRVGWPEKLRQLAQTLPRGVSLQQLTASTSAGASSSSGGGSLRGSLDVPAFELTGCAADQDQVAQTLTDLQSLTGVSRVSLSDSQTADDAAASGESGSPDSGSGSSASSCGARPTFSAVVFFSAPAGSPPTGQTPTTAP